MLQDSQDVGGQHLPTPVLVADNQGKHKDWQARAMIDLLSRLNADDIHVHGDGVVDGKIILWCDHHRGMAITVDYQMACTMLAALDDGVKSPTVWSIITAIKLKTPRQKAGGGLSEVVKHLSTGCIQREGDKKR